MNCIDPETQLMQAKPTAKYLIRCLVCPTHKRKLRVECDFDDTGVRAFLSKCCCKPITEVALTLLENTQLFHTIEVEYIEPKDTSGHSSNNCSGSTIG
ncbi:hypothetical protein PG303_07170 [Riemerella anatipestifer]|uniref:Uncharacterized protein n=1 Tax=Riemerella anatipestifer TaxID=34085 RepID=A0AAP6HFP3_RIEAN|nr:hypothetical protein [Riemerella anatipestifer]